MNSLVKEGREHLLRALRSRVNTYGSAYEMHDMLELLLDAVEAIRVPMKSADDDDPAQIEATAAALADVATLILCIADVRWSRQ